MDMMKDLKDFHEKFGLEYNGPPRMLSPDIAEFRTKFMHEELSEYVTCQYQDVAGTLPEQVTQILADQLDALVDLVYVALGTAYLHGFDFNEAWRRVHEANMKKVRALRATDSKRGSVYDVVKPEGWVPPDLTDLIVITKEPVSEI